MNYRIIHIPYPEIIDEWRGKFLCRKEGHRFATFEPTGSRANLFLLIWKNCERCGKPNPDWKEGKKYEYKDEENSIWRAEIVRNERGELVSTSY